MTNTQAAAHGERYAEVARRAARIARQAEAGADFGAIAAACQRLAAIASYMLVDAREQARR